MWEHKTAQEVTPSSQHVSWQPHKASELRGVKEKAGKRERVSSQLSEICRDYDEDAGDVLEHPGRG